VLLDLVVLFKDSTSFWSKAVFFGCLVPLSIINPHCYHWPSRQWDRLYVEWNWRLIQMGLKALPASAVSLSLKDLRPGLL
jgi:hypothetical protein